MKSESENKGTCESEGSEKAHKIFKNHQAPKSLLSSPSPNLFFLTSRSRVNWPYHLRDITYYFINYYTTSHRRKEASGYTITCPYGICLHGLSSNSLSSIAFAASSSTFSSSLPSSFGVTALSIGLNSFNLKVSSLSP